MKPLIEIQTVPISIEYKVSHSKFQRADSSATVELSRSGRGGYRMKSRPISLNVDTIEASRIPPPRVSRSKQPISQPGAGADTSGAGTLGGISAYSMASYSATAHFLGNGNVQVDMTLNDAAVAQITQMRRDAATADPNYSPDYPSEETVVPQNLSVTYELDKRSFDTSASSRNIEFEFVPASIEFTIAEYPKVVIEYIGEPLYVPPSANPNYEPVDKRV